MKNGLPRVFSGPPQQVLICSHGSDTLPHLRYGRSTCLPMTIHRDLIRSSGAFEVEAQKSGNELSVTSLQGYTEEAFFLTHLSENRIPTASGDQAVQLWDRSSGAFEVETQNLDSGKPMMSMQGSTEEASSPVNLSDNARMLTASHEKAMHLWDRWSATFDPRSKCRK